MSWHSAASPTDGQVGSKFRLRDLLGEAATATFARPGRAALTALGTALGTGSLVAIAGLGQTVSNQVASTFDARRSTEVVLVDTAPSQGDPAYSSEGLGRLTGLNGVAAAGEIWQVDDSVTTGAALYAETSEVPLYAASRGALDALDVTVGEGRLFDAVSGKLDAPEVILGAVAARRLGISSLERLPAVFIDGQPHLVIGVLEDIGRRPQLLTAMLVTPERAARHFAAVEVQPREVQILTVPGAAQLVSAQAPLALRPQDPGRFQVQSPPDPRTLRRSIEDDLRQMVYLLGGVALLAGMITIMGNSLGAVIERISEIGLRRAVGARRSHIAGQFVVESSLTGLLGGAIGAIAGCATIAVVALTQRWAPVLDPTLPLVAPAVGTVTGVLAGVLPGWRASRIPPVEALRR